METGEFHFPYFSYFTLVEKRAEKSQKSQAGGSPIKNR
jgi:hypothetical protein